MGTSPKIARFPMNLSTASSEAALLKGSNPEAVSGDPVRYKLITESVCSSGN
ncbi:MAG: hypothetical protein VB050_03835 [Geobacteraceae bacterium]|nr:hypothetical protein [Geobacteraceae bacterium]